MRSPPFRLPAFVFLTAALGGRPIFAFAWALWLGVVMVAVTWPQLLGPRAATSHAVAAFASGCLLTVIVCARLLSFLSHREQRQLLFSLDPRCSAVEVSLFSRLAVLSVSILGLFAIAAKYSWH